MPYIIPACILVIVFFARIVSGILISISGSCAVLDQSAFVLILIPGQVTRADTAYLLETEPKSATPAEIAEMVAYNELPVDGEIGFVYVAKDKNEIDVDVETIKRE